MEYNEIMQSHDLKCILWEDTQKECKLMSTARKISYRLKLQKENISFDYQTSLCLYKISINKM